MHGFFENFVFELEAFSYMGPGLSLTKQLISPQKMFFILIFVSPVTFNPLSSLLKCVTTLVATAYRNMESRQSGRTTYMMRIKESERGPFFKFLNGILFCTIHTRWMKLL